MASKSLLSGTNLCEDTQGRKNLVDVLRIAAESDRGVQFVSSTVDQQRDTYSTLLKEAKSLAVEFQASSKEPLRTTVLLQVQSLRDQVVASWAALLSGLPCVCLDTCGGDKENAQAAARFEFCLKAFDQCLVVCDESSLNSVCAISEKVAQDRVELINVADQMMKEADWQLPDVSPDDIAFYFLTSGSTSAPKVVPQSHHAILNFARASQIANEFDENDVFLNWLPLDHVGGIVMMHLQCLVIGCDQIQCNNRHVLQDINRWFDACDRFEATVTWAPQFAFDRILEKSNRQNIKRWNLSKLRVLLNGGETVSAERSHLFLDVMEKAQLDRHALRPVWGMSETCSGVLVSEDFDAVDREAPYTPIGFPIPTISTRIVDETGRILLCGDVGQLELKGPSVITAYRKTDGSPQAQPNPDGWLGTGDKAYIGDAGVVVCGRSNETVVVNGRNISLGEIESMIKDRHASQIRSICAIAVDGASKGPRVAALVGVGNEFKELSQLVHAINGDLFKLFGFQFHETCILPEAEFERSSIGKVSRSRMNERYRLQEFKKYRWSSSSPQQNQLSVDFRDTCHVRSWHNQNRPSNSDCTGNLIVITDADPPSSIISGLNEGITCSYLRLVPDRAQCEPQGSAFAAQVGSNIESWTSAFASLSASTDHNQTCVFIPSQATPEFQQFRSIYLSSLVSLLQAVRRLQLSLSAIFITHNSQKVIETVSSGNPIEATLGCFLRAASAEVRGFSGMCIDLGPGETLELDMICNETSNGLENAETAYRDGNRFVCNLEPVDMRSCSPSLLAEDTRNIIVFGGLGGIGYHFCKALARVGGTRLFIVGRTKPEHLPQSSSLKLAELQSDRADVGYISATTMDYGSIAKALDTVLQSVAGPLHHVFDLTGQFASNLVENLGSQDALDIIESLVQGSTNLVEACSSYDIHNLTFFSSANSYFSGPMVAQYSGASRFREALAESPCHGHSTNVRCVCWPMWSGTGLAENFKVKAKSLSDPMYVINPAEISAQLLELSFYDLPSYFIGIDNEALNLPAGLQDSGSPENSLAAAHGCNPERTGTKQLHQEELRVLFCEIVGRDIDSYDENLFDHGLNSLHVVEIQLALAENLQTFLSLDDLIENPTIRHLTRVLAQRSGETDPSMTLSN